MERDFGKIGPNPKISAIMKTGYPLRIENRERKDKEMKKQLKKLLLLLVTTLLVIVAPASVSAAKKPTPGKVKLTKIAATDYNKINVKWNKVSNATHYKVYYKKTGSKNWNYITTVKGRNTTSYTHKSSKNDPIICGQKYTYTVKGYNSKYKTNGKYDTKGLTAYTKPTTVKLKKAALSSNKSSVTVTWNKAYGGNYYAVYRKTPSTGWSRIKNLSGRYTSYTDNSPVKGQKNIYTVRCYSTSTKVYGNYNKSGVSVSVPAAVKNYTVKFDAQGGKAVASQTVKSGTTIKMPSTSRSGYKFLGWYTAKTGGSKVTSLKVTKNVTLYAHWQKNAPATIKVQRIELNTDGFSVEVGKTYQVKAKVYPENATNKKVKWVTSGGRISVSDTGLVTGLKEGMTAVTAIATDGSGVKASCEISVDPARTPEPETTPTPRPEKPETTPTPQPVKKCTVKFDPQGGSPVAPITVDAGTEITLPKSSREGYTLMGWYTMPQGGERVSDPLLVEDSMMLFAYWKQNQEGVVEDVTIAGGDSKTIGPDMGEFPDSVDFKKVTFDIPSNTNIEVMGFNSSKYAAGVTVKGLRKGTVSVFVKYNGKVLKRYNVTVTSDWQEYLGYVSWRKGVESQIWNNSMNVTQKLDAARDYIRTNFKYSNKSGSAVYAYKNKLADCITSSEMMGDFAKDLGLKVGYYNVRTGKIYDYLVESYSVSDGHICNMIMLNGQWVEYDAQPPH